MQAITSTTQAKSQASQSRTRRVDPSAFYIKALKDAGGFHRQSFFIEMAVCLAFYAENDSAALPARKALRPIYEKAGYDCKDHKGEDYKTVARRIGAASELFIHLGGKETLTDWVEGHTGSKGIELLVKELEKRKLDSIDAVKKAVGKPATRAYKPRQQAPATQGAPQAQLSAEGASRGLPGDATDQAIAALVGSNIDMQRAVRMAATPVPPERVLKTEHLVCTIPFEATQEEVKSLALMLLEFSTTKMGAAVTN